MPSSPLANVRAVLFDAVGTLIEPDPPVARAYRVVGERFGVALAEEEVSRRFRRAFARQEDEDAQRRDWRTSEERERERWRRIVREVFPSAAAPEGLFAALWEHFAQPGNWRLFDDVAAAWQDLSARGLVLGVASNFDLRLEAISRALPPLSVCEHVFTSSRLGCRKPGREFFRSIEAELGLRPEQLLLVGDDLANDDQGAREAGWTSIILRRSSRVQNAIQTLAELTARINRWEVGSGKWEVRNSAGEPPST